MKPRIRVWNRTHKYMTEELSMTFYDGKQHWYYTDAEDGISVETDDWVMMVFTGLHDKNGKEIWEGDVVRGVHYKGKTKDVVFETIWHGNGSSACFLFKDSLATACHPYELQALEVIGNIYENPELIKSL